MFQLCQRVVQLQGEREEAASALPCYDVFALFLSNAEQRLLLFEQRAGEQERGRICWDYHVICIARPRRPQPSLSTSSTSSPAGSSPPLPPLLSPPFPCSSSLVYDLDSRLPFPCSFSCYVQRALLPALDYSPSFHPLFRVLPAAQLLSTFASDRSHMRSAEGGYLATPPPWPSIGRGHNLSQFTCMSAEQLWTSQQPSESAFGAVLDLHQLVHAFGADDEA